MISETEKPTKRRRRVRIWRVLVAIVVVLIVAVCVLRWHWRHEFRKRIAGIAAAGYPVTPEELGAWYPAPESGENGAQTVLYAADCYVDMLTSRESHSLNRLHVLARRDLIGWWPTIREHSNHCTKPPDSLITTTISIGRLILPGRCGLCRPSTRR